MGYRSAVRGEPLGTERASPTFRKARKMLRIVNILFPRCSETGNQARPEDCHDSYVALTRFDPFRYEYQMAT